MVGNPGVGRGVSIKTIRIRLRHESLDVTLAYLKGKDAETGEAAMDYRAAKGLPRTFV